MVRQRRWWTSAVFLGALLGGCVQGPSAPGATTGGGTTDAPTQAAAGSPLRLVIDTDMAPDDVVAIASLLRDPAVEALAILVDGTGEAHCQGGMFVARSVVTMLLDRAIPVTCGSATPIGDAEPFPDAWRAGADTGSGIRLVSPTFAPDPKQAPELLVELAAAEAALGERLTILTTGTLTNIASALELDPDLPKKVRMVSMLGAVGVPGNVQTQGVTNPTAEWNAHADPSAVARVLAAGFDLTLIPLDATNDVPLTRQLFTALEADHAAGPADLVYEIWARNPFMVEGGFHLWDPLALRDPSIVTTRTARVRVLEGAAADGGRLVEDPAGADVTIATSANRPRFEEFLLEHLRIGGPRAQSFAPVVTLTVAVGPTTCEAAFTPSARAGLARIEATSSAGDPRGVVVFGLGELTWDQVVAFSSAPPQAGASPPPVAFATFLDVAPGGAATGFGELTAGQAGVACLRDEGQDADFSMALAGPFEVAQ
jgi:inosine-uridine nucleoside N-ribohydrolase